MAITRNVDRDNLNTVCQELAIFLQGTLLDFSGKVPYVKGGRTLNAILQNNTAQATQLDVEPANKQLLVYHYEPECDDNVADCDTIDVCATGTPAAKPLRKDLVTIEKCAAANPWTFDVNFMLGVCELVANGGETQQMFASRNLAREARKIVNKMNNDAIDFLYGAAGNYFDGTTSSLGATVDFPILNSDGTINYIAFALLRAAVERSGFMMEDFYIIVGEQGNVANTILQATTGSNINGVNQTFGIPNLIYDPFLDSQIGDGNNSKMILVHKDFIHLLEWFMYGNYATNSMTGRNYLSNAVDSEEFTARVLEVQGSGYEFDFTVKRDFCPHPVWTWNLFKHYDFYNLPEVCGVNGIMVFNLTCEEPGCTTTDLFATP